MSIPNFNLFNKFCFDEADETLSHVSNYYSLNNNIIKFILHQQC